MQSVGDFFAEFDPYFVLGRINNEIIAANVVGHGLVEGGFELADAVVFVVWVIYLITWW